MNAKFKIGDKVVVVDARGSYNIPLGEILTVSHVQQSADETYEDAFYYEFVGQRDGLYECRLELLEASSLDVFLNEALVPFKDLPDEQKLLIIREKMKGNVEMPTGGFEWIKAEDTSLCFNLAYRTKPVEPIIEHTPIDIPWQFIKPEYKWAAMDKDATLWVFDIEPEAQERQWYYNGGHGKLLEIEALNIPTEGIIWDLSLTMRPEAV